MAIRVASHAIVGSLFILDDVKKQIIACIESVPFRSPYDDSNNSWWRQTQRTWMDPNFWIKGGWDMKSEFPPVEGVSETFEFKDKTYVQLGMTYDGYRQWRSVDHLTDDSHDKALAQISGEKHESDC